MDHDQSIVVNKMEADGCESKQEFLLAGLLPWYVLEGVVSSPLFEFGVQLFDRLVDLAWRLELRFGGVQPAIDATLDQRHAAESAEERNVA